MSFISFENVFFSYHEGKEKFALEGINLSITEGDFLAVMGENGAGKTSFCKLINGIIPHLTGGKLTGNVIVDGLNTKEVTVPQLSLKAGIVLDDPDAQLFTSTVRHEAAFGPENLCLPEEDIEQRIEYALKAVGLSGFEDRQPPTLSGGEKQRLSIAASLSMKGKILVLDEPLCRLDPQGARELLNVLKEINEKFRITIIIASGNTSLMAEYASKVCILKNGKITAYDTAKNIFSNSALLEENGIEPITNLLSLSSNLYSLFPVPCTLPSSSVININNFSYTYHDGVTIENINLSIVENDITAVIGDNGCGKTTLLKNITGLLRPSKGGIFIRGKNTKELTVSEISNDIGFVMQNPQNQLFTDSCFKEIAFALKNMRLSKSEIKRRTEEALDTAGIKDKTAFPHSLCRADQTKTVLACVIAMGVKIILLDEPDVGNDYKGNLKIMNTLKELQSKRYTVIFVTHNMSLASLADRLIKMDRKGIVFDGRRN